MKTWRVLPILVMIAMTVIPISARAGESKFVLRDYLNQAWTDELLTYPFSAAKGTCDARSVTLTGPHGALGVGKRGRQ